MLISSGKPGGAQVLHRSDLCEDERRQLFGSVDLLGPAEITAGGRATLKFSIAAGSTGLPVGGRLRIAWRWPFDWSPLQIADAAADGYLSVRVQRPPGRDPGGLSLRPDFHARGDFDPWNHHIELTVVQGSVREGDRIEINCGDRTGGGGGWRAPTFACKAEFLVAVNADGGGGVEWTRLVDPLAISVVPGPPEHMVLMLPTDAMLSQPFHLHLRVEDGWGNPTKISGEILPGLGWMHAGGDGSAGLVEDGAELPPTAETELLDDPPIYRFRVAGAEHSGTYVAVASAAGTDLSARSNPLRVHAQQPPRRIFWGDLHSGQTEIGCGAGSLSAHFRFARHAAGLQFAAQQSNDHYVTSDLWRRIQEETEAAHDRNGGFVSFLGCEWSPPTADGGDRNVIYRQRRPRLRRSGRFFTESTADPDTDLSTALPFLAAMEKEEVFHNLHVGGRPTNLDFHAPGIEPLVEIHSTHGTSEWFLKDALSRGYRVGITAGTDGVMGRPGADHPGWRQNRNLRSGLTAVYARELTREALWEALRARHCYATTGERIILQVEADGHGMGEEYEAAGPPEIRIAAIGTAAIERVDLLRGTSTVKSWTIARPAPQRGCIRLLWSGTQERGTAAAQRVRWDGSLRVTGGRVLGWRPLGFQSPEDAAWQQRSGTVCWRSITAGNRAGLVLEIEGDECTRCVFSSMPCEVEFEFALGRVGEETLTVDAGGVGRRVEVGPAPAEDGRRAVEGLDFRDEEGAVGTSPYWVRLVQVDQAMAWSSPVYVTRRPQ